MKNHNTYILVLKDFIELIIIVSSVKSFKGWMKMRKLKSWSELNEKEKEEIKKDFFAWSEEELSRLKFYKGKRGWVGRDDNFLKDIVFVYQRTKKEVKKNVDNV